MKYKVTLNSKVYEVEVEKGEATLLSEYEAVVPAPAVAAPVVVAAPVPVAAAVPVAATAPAPVAAADGEPVNSPLPGSIHDIRVKVGDSVNTGDVLFIIEAMKMENEVVAPKAGKVTQIAVTKGQNVETGALLLVLA